MEGLTMKYFVVKPEGRDEYAKASRAAMMAYATAINKHNKELANSLWGWVEREQLSSQNTVRRVATMAMLRSELDRTVDLMKILETQAEKLQVDNLLLREALERRLIVHAPDTDAHRRALDALKGGQNDTP
jgi:hypothetical protein